MDNLTLLPNRQKLIDDINNADNPVLILVNIDSFKEINDFYGNDIGDSTHFHGKQIKVPTFQSGYNAYKIQADEYAVFMDMVIPMKKSMYLLKTYGQG